MSFFTELKDDATAVEQAVVSGLKDGLEYVDNVIVHDILPELKDAFLQALKTLGQDALAVLLAKVGITQVAQTETPPDAPSAG